MSITFVTDPADARLADYRALQDRRLNEEGGRFIAESEMVVRRLLASGLDVVSVLVTAPRLRALEEALRAAGDPPVLVVPQEIMDAVAGFHVHRGCLAIAARPLDVRVPDDARGIVVLEDLVDVDNLGALARNAAAFGAGALVLSPRCADPFYRKAIRVSMGSVLTLPIVRLERWPDDLLTLKARLGLTIVGAVVDEAATPLATLAPPERFALLLGAEGPGLSSNARAVCDALVTIPMAATVDSLNVATAGAIFLFHLAGR